jgi:hypothetical protein
MLSRRIPDLPLELFDSIHDKSTGAESQASLCRCNVITQFSVSAMRDVEESGVESELLNIVLDYLKEPTEEKARSGELMAGFVGMIYEGHLLTCGFEKDDFETALEMAEEHFNNEDGTGTSCFERANDQVIGMSMYAAAFTVTQELINVVNKQAMLARPDLPPVAAGGHTLQ